jgi:cell division protein FtsB
MKKPATFLIFAGLLVLFVILLMPKVMHVQKLKARSQNLDQEIKSIQLENQRMENELKLLREDPVYLEKVAREKFNKAKEGEIVYKVVRQPDVSPQQ